MRHKIKVNITLHPFIIIIIITWYLTRLCSLPKNGRKAAVNRTAGTSLNEALPNCSNWPSICWRLFSSRHPPQQPPLAVVTIQGVHLYGLFT